MSFAHVISRFIGVFGGYCSHIVPKFGHVKGADEAPRAQDEFHTGILIVFEIHLVFAAIEDWTQLDCCCFRTFMTLSLTDRSRAGYRGTIVRPTYREKVSMIAPAIASAYSSSGKWPPSK